MALPTAYLTTAKNLDGILAAIQNAKAPPKFTQQFLRGLGFQSSSDRLAVNVLKALGFLSADGVPTQRYFDYLDPSQGPRVMGEAVIDAYADLFEINKRAYTLSRKELKNKMRTLSQGQLTDSVLDKMAMTFTALAKHSDFDSANAANGPADEEATPSPDEGPPDGDGTGGDSDGDHGPDGRGRINDDSPRGGTLVVDGLIYNIQIQLPESRDPRVYDALFQSLKQHLGR
jgi:hypothetical protein